MLKSLFITILLFSSALLFSVHNLTINDADSLQVSIGDTIRLDFDFEDIGNSATIKLQIYVSTFDFPVISPENATLTDGSALDETPIDGHFSYHFENFFCLPQTSWLKITLTDQDISDEVKITFLQLDSNFSIAGNILKEGEHINTPVRGAFVYSFYNADREELRNLFDNPTSDEFMDYMLQDRYFISVLSNNSGEYTINVPDDEPNVPCTVDVMSALDTNNEKVSPETQELTVNGALNDVDLIYQNPDGHFTGTILDTQSDSLANCLMVIRNADTTRTVFTFSDSLGSFDIPLLNDEYNLKISKPGYQDYNETFTISNSDYDETIVLQSEITHLDKPENLYIQINGDSLNITWDSVENADYYSVYSTENPNLPYSLWNTEIDSTSALMWKTAINAQKRFFIIKAKRN